jgi:WD40 repeat protein
MIKLTGEGKMHLSKISAHRSFVIELVLLFLLCSCPDNKVPSYVHGTFPETVTPLSGANSSYDDFNSMPPPSVVNLAFPLYFSSNRATQGGSFDVESFEVDVQWDQTSGGTSLSAHESVFSSPWPDFNSASNELGPYYIEIDYPNKVYMFASDRNGNLDIFYALNSGTAQPALALNSAADDAYPSLGPDNVFYFSSNRSGGYDIYSAPVPTGQSLVNFLASAGASIVPVEPVNSAWDDKAPYVNGNLMLFASNRPGGYGGYDLWYSTRGEGGWSQPVNFGPQINSASDEFRPVVVISDPTDFTNDVMVFSSNRPGGIGGFDLYYVGIPRMTQ